jgi:hypothetical protein
MPISTHRPDIRLVSEGIPDLLPMLSRSPGTHLSAIIHDLCVRLGYYKERGRDHLDMTRMQLGCALEDSVIQRYAAHYPGRYIQPGEVQADGVYITPDLLDTESWAAEEVKLTWMGAVDDPLSDKLRRYWWQILGECVGLGTDVGRLNVTFINGDYRGERRPINRVWERRFTRQELADTWGMLVNHGKKIGRH